MVFSFLNCHKKNRLYNFFSINIYVSFTAYSFLIGFTFGNGIFICKRYSPYSKKKKYIGT